MPDFLDLSFHSKGSLTSEIKSILKDADFCGLEPPKYDHLEALLAKLKDDVCFVIDYPYIDPHFRDTYYTFHSSKFNKTGRDCIRVHIFEDKIVKNDLLNRKNTLNKKYMGFFVIRPLTLHVLGRSLISPNALKNSDFVCCLMKDRVTLLGNEFTVHGFPHIAQDEETHTCAESALWSLIEYFGSKYNDYKPLLPSQLIKPLLNNSEHRLLPSIGLTINELAKCLQNNGFHCNSYWFGTKNSILSSRMLRIYIESGIPLLVVLSNKVDRHAVLAIGHDNSDSIYEQIKNHPRIKNNHSFWIDVSYSRKDLIFIDDNMPPYQRATLTQPTKHYSIKKQQNMVIETFIVPLPKRMFLLAEKMYGLIEKIFDDEKIGFQNFHEKRITRMLLTSSRSFKKFLLKHEEKMSDILKEWLLRLAMPQFIWICEIYKEQNFIKDGYCSGLLIVDATSNGKTLESVLWYTLDDILFEHNGLFWNKEATRIIPFEMSIYRSNLKGEGKKWES